MKTRMLSSLILAATIGLSPISFAMAKEGMERMTAKTFKMKSGKEVTIMVGEMDGKMMAVIPFDEMNELLMRAEGHTMATGP